MVMDILNCDYPEKLIEQQIVNWLKGEQMSGNLKSLIWFKVFNEGRRTVQYQSMMSKQGFKSGMSDLVLCWPDRVIFVEIKSKKGRLSASQKLFQLECEERGHKYSVVRSLIEFNKIIKKRLNMEII